MSSTEPLSKKQRCDTKIESVIETGQVDKKTICHQFDSLFQICIQFIAKHIDLVDSLVGFPDIIGLKIFQCAKTLKKFSNASKDSRLALELFCDAYGDSVMSSVSLRSCHLGIADYLDHVCLFSDLSELDMGHCGLGDDHELLQHISNCHSLTKLGLSDNALTDRGIQKLTSPLRMFHRGPRNLTLLDLSDNPDITCSVSRFLKIFNLLAKLNLTGTSIKASHVKYIEEKLFMKCKPEACPNNPCLTENRGWAADVVTEWMSQSAETAIVVKPKSETSKFYQRTSVINQLLGASKQPSVRKPTEVIYLVKSVSNVSNIHKQKLSNHSENLTSKNHKVKTGNKNNKMNRDLPACKSRTVQECPENVSGFESTLLSLYSSESTSKSGINSKSLSTFMEEW